MVIVGHCWPRLGLVGVPRYLLVPVGTSWCLLVLVGFFVGAFWCSLSLNIVLAHVGIVDTCWSLIVRVGKCWSSWVLVGVCW